MLTKKGARTLRPLIFGRSCLRQLASGIFSALGFRVSDKSSHRFILRNRDSLDRQSWPRLDDGRLWHAGSGIGIVLPALHGSGGSLVGPGTKVSFWSLNLGLAWMVFATLFPLEDLQLYHSVNRGIWIRSSKILDKQEQCVVGMGPDFLATCSS